MKESLINKKYKNLNKNSKIYSILVMKNQEKIIFKKRKQQGVQRPTAKSSRE